LEGIAVPSRKLVAEYFVKVCTESSGKRQDAGASQVLQVEQSVRLWPVRKKNSTFLSAAKRIDRAVALFDPGFYDDLLESMKTPGYRQYVAPYLGFKIFGNSLDLRKKIEILLP
jgi:hypothetical protein